MGRKKNLRNTKGRIVSAAWKLFYEQGYENTTIEDIVFESETSRGSFYHYFNGKDDLLGSLADVFDEKYVEIMAEIDGTLSSFDKLLYLNRELFGMIENGISMELLARLYSTQLVTAGSRNLLDHKRAYYKIIRQIVSEGQKNGELTESISTSGIVKAYALCERALIYDWCLCSGEYSLKNYAAEMLPMFLNSFRTVPEKKKEGNEGRKTSKKPKKTTPSEM